MGGWDLTFVCLSILKSDFFHKLKTKLVIGTQEHLKAKILIFTVCCDSIPNTL